MTEVELLAAGRGAAGFDNRRVVFPANSERRVFFGQLRGAVRREFATTAGEASARLAWEFPISGSLSHCWGSASVES
jgi:hypothetical protein